MSSMSTTSRHQVSDLDSENERKDSAVALPPRHYTKWQYYTRNGAVERKRRLEAVEGRYASLDAKPYVAFVSVESLPSTHPFAHTKTVDQRKVYWKTLPMYSGTSLPVLPPTPVPDMRRGVDEAASTQVENGGEKAGEGARKGQECWESVVRTGGVDVADRDKEGRVSVETFDTAEDGPSGREDRGGDEELSQFAVSTSSQSCQVEDQTQPQKSCDVADPANKSKSQSIGRSKLLKNLLCRPQSITPTLEQQVSRLPVRVMDRSTLPARFKMRTGWGRKREVVEFDIQNQNKGKGKEAEEGGIGSESGKAEETNDEMGGSDKSPTERFESKLPKLSHRKRMPGIIPGSAKARPASSSSTSQNVSSDIMGISPTAPPISTDVSGTGAGISEALNATYPRSDTSTSVSNDLDRTAQTYIPTSVSGRDVGIHEALEAISHPVPAPTSPNSTDQTARASPSTSTSTSTPSPTPSLQDRLRKTSLSDLPLGPSGAQRITTILRAIESNKYSTWPHSQPPPRPQVPPSTFDTPIAPGSILLDLLASSPQTHARLNDEHEGLDDETAQQVNRAAEWRAELKGVYLSQCRGARNDAVGAQMRGWAGGDGDEKVLAGGGVGLSSVRAAANGDVIEIERPRTRRARPMTLPLSAPVLKGVVRRTPASYLTGECYRPASGSSLRNVVGVEDLSEQRDLGEVESDEQGMNGEGR